MGWRSYFEDILQSSLILVSEHSSVLSSHINIIFPLKQYQFIFTLLGVTCKEAFYLLPKEAYISGSLPVVVGSSLQIQCQEGTVTRLGETTQHLICQNDHTWVPSHLHDCEGNFYCAIYQYLGRRVLA